MYSEFPVGCELQESGLLASIPNSVLVNCVTVDTRLEVPKPQCPHLQESTVFSHLLMRVHVRLRK